MSPEREEYHRQIAAQLERLGGKPGVIIDIGVSTTHDYRKMFANHCHLTVDREPRKKPDYVIDLEKDFPSVPRADLILCNGVTETCGDPFAVVRNIRRMMHGPDTVLFGIMLLGYPLGTKADFTRFTPIGAERLVQSAGFKIQSSSLVYRDAVPSYAFVTAVAD